MLKQILLILIVSITHNAFSQTLAENEKRLTSLLDSLDNDYYWQSIPENFMGAIPNNNYQYKYPHRLQLHDLIHKINIQLQKPLSEAYLLTLYNLKHFRKLSQNYRLIADKIIASNSQNTQLRLWKIVTDKHYKNQDFLDYQLTMYVVYQFIYRSILKDYTRKYILENKDYSSHYYGYFDKEIDLKIIEAQIEYLKTERKKPQMGDAERWAAYLFLEAGIRPNSNCRTNYKDWYFDEFYLKRKDFDPKLSIADFNWDNYDNLKNINLTIRYLKSIKENYDKIKNDCISK